MAVNSYNEIFDGDRDKLRSGIQRAASCPIKIITGGVAIQFISSAGFQIFETLFLFYRMFF
jgi:hypothetical protein